MSFILDALKKSESERQSQGTAEFRGVPSSARSPRVSRWLWIVGLLLAINLAVVVSLLLRPEVVPTGSLVSQTNDISLPATTQSSFAEQVSQARQDATPMQAAPVKTTQATAQSPQPVSTSRNSALIPSIHEVRANGIVSLPELHLDIHVYSDVPEDRFVFINMAKQREGTRLSEGPVVAEITPDGVVLNYQGTLFLLPRE